MRITLAVLAGIVALVLPGTAAAIPPTNDNFANATVVGSLPYSDVVNTTDSTTEAGEPQFCSFMDQTVWYSFTPATTSVVSVDNGGTGFLTNVNVYRSLGPGITSLGFLGCSGNGGSVTFQAEAGVTYYVQTGILLGTVGDLHINFSEIPPPPNDDFADAHSVGALPYFEVVDMHASTLEPNEPTPSGVSPFLGTAWWKFSAPKSGPMLITETGCCGSRIVGAYTGGSLGSLVEVPMTRSFGRAIFTATEGTIYMIQLGHYGGLYGDGKLGISVQEAPGLSTAIFWSPFDPSSYDAVEFFGHGFDPAAFPIDSWSWDFGDGGSGTGQSASHRYLSDGDYEVTMTARTIDGRVGTSTQTVSIRTHDVGITKLTVPQAVSVGHTRSIGVSVLARRYDETVTVTLYRSDPGGFAVVGSSTQIVAKRKRATPYTFSYTFTAADAAIGTVTFKAVATINGARDALPADNEIVALPTKVNG